MTLSIAKLCHYAECRDLFIGMLNVVMVSVIMLSVIRLSVVECRCALSSWYNISW
jgi:hypothetical protein